MPPIPAGMPPIPGAAPPIMPPGGTGAAAVPSPMAGSAASGQSKVKLALNMLQEALPNLPMGSELHTAVIESITKITKHFDENLAGGPDAAIQQLLQLARSQQTNPQHAAMASMLPMSGGVGGAPAIPPPMAAPPGGMA